MEKVRKFPKIPERWPERHFHSFGPFRVDPVKRVLFRGSEPLSISPKTFDLLLTLVEQQGEVLLKDELMQNLWPDTVVEEGNLNRHISTLRKLLGESPEDHQYIVTVPGRGYRFVAEVHEVWEENGQPEELTIGSANEDAQGSSHVDTPRSTVSELPLPVAQALPGARQQGKRGFSRTVKLLLGMGIAFCLVVALVLVWRLRSQPILSESDHVLISDFANRTSDPVFDSTLKQAVSVAFGQSPFMNVISEDRISATLKLMTQPPDVHLTPALARDLCQRVGARVYIDGSIDSMGSQFVVSLNAVDCETGNSLAQEQVTAENKEHVLQALGGAAERIRKRLGESRSSLKRFRVPLIQATTSSLDALQAFTLGDTARDRQGDAAAIPFYKHAIERDPSFALAYDALGIAYSNLSEPGLAADAITKAYGLRERASERENFQITANYSQIVTGELQKSNQVCELWSQIYPHDVYPRNLLAVNLEFLGEYEKAATESKLAIELNPQGAILRSNLMDDLIALNRLDEAKESYRAALANGLDHPYLHVDRYAIAFLQGDQPEMAKQVKEGAALPGGEDLLLSAESDSQAYWGNLAKARELSQRAFESARHANQMETAALWVMNSALREAEFGNRSEALKEASSGLASAPTRDVQILAALIFARSGESARTSEIVNDLSQRYPLNTALNVYWNPSIRAALELNRNEPAKALEYLQAASPFDSAYPNPQVEVGRYLYPAYLRGLVYLRLKRGPEAASTFKDILERRSLGLNCPLEALAQLGLARALLLGGNKPDAKSAYEEYFDLWKNADANIPILKEARAEYAKLQ